MAANPKHTIHEITRNLTRQHEPTAKKVPALALTGYGRSADIERARAAGFAQHLTKPLDIARLLEIVRELTEGSAV